MVQLLRLAAVLVLLIGGVSAIDMLPARGAGGSTLTGIVDCVLRDHGQAQAQAQAPVPVPGVQATPAARAAPTVVPALPASPADCGRFLPSFYIATVALVGSLLLGAFGSLLYNTRRSREIMEQFASGAPGR